jgi:hypothetical protein
MLTGRITLTVEGVEDQNRINTLSRRGVGKRKANGRGNLDQKVHQEATGWLLARDLEGKLKRNESR